ncbi:hypothetical protein [Cupriavidus sp. BIC8F]|uniref:hypothetical protein n=1 Tax=Cupriavidus sp. BIC8F TaxID=3079014 RepID=UPI00291666CE|nr:hypothetical protein [Cupriavidus sp. BIC8F]
MTPWFQIVHIGEDTQALALAGFITVCLACAGYWKRAFRWVASLGVGAGLVLAGKLAFEFYGWFLPSLGLYSISGHAMLTAAVYPVMCMLLGSTVGERAARYGIVAGLWVALVMAIVLVAGRYHTLAETLIGAAIGLCVAWINARPVVSLRGHRVSVLLAALLAVLALAALPRMLEPIKESLWAQGARWLDVTMQCIRDIDVDPASGQTVVRVLQCPVSLPANRPPRAARPWLELAAG